MNLTNADSVFINGKEVQQISIDGNIVYTAGYHIHLSADKSFIRPGETVTISVNCEDLPYTQIELYEVINMTRIYLDTLETDESGKATYEHESYGVGEVGFVAVYDEKESNTVIVDEYNPIISRVTLSASSSNIPYGTPVTFTARVIDQHGQPFTHGSVTFNDGQTSIGDGQLNNDGVATLTVSNLSGGSHSIIAEAIMVYSSPVEVNVVKSNTILTIDVPALVYSDNFSVTGILKNESNIPISGATVRLKWTVGSQENSTTAVTNSDGEVTFATQAPTSITNYTFKLEYDGNANYNASASSIVQRTVGKETSIINISSPSSPITVAGSSFNVVGVLTDNDGTPLKEEMITAHFNSLPIYEMATTSNDGSFTLTIPTSSLSDGQYSLQINFSGSSTYTDADVSLTVVKASFDGIDLESDKDILSAKDNEYATLTAQLTLSDVPVSVSGETVTFEVRKESDDSLVETLTGVTDSSGIATVSYLGKGANSLYIQAYSSSPISDKIYIEDCWLFDDTTSIDTNKWNVSGNVTVSSTYGFVFPKSNTKLYLKELIGEEYSIEWDWNYYGSSTSFPMRIAFFNSSGSTPYQVTMQRYSTYDKFFGGMGIEPQFHAGNQCVFKFEVTHSFIKGYVNNELIFTYTNTRDYAQYLVGFMSDSNIGQYVKNIKIKLL